MNPTLIPETNVTNDRAARRRQPWVVPMAALLAVLLALSANVAGQLAPPNLDREVIVDSKKLSEEVNGAYGQVSRLLKESTLPNLAGKLRAMAEAKKPTSTDEVVGVLKEMDAEYERLSQGLGPATGTLEGAESAVANAIGSLQNHLAKRSGDAKAGADAKVLLGHDAHLRGLGERILRTKDPTERRNLEALFDSSYVLRNAVEKAHGKMSDSERKALARVIEFLLRLQTDLAVAATRTKTLAVSIGHERALIGHFGDVLKVVNDSQNLITVLNGLNGVGADFMGGLDGQFGRDIAPLLERFLDDSSKGVDAASSKLLDKSVAKGQPTLTDEQRQDVMRKVGVVLPGAKGGE